MSELPEVIQTLPVLTATQKLDLENAAKAYGPDHAVVWYWVALGHSGLSPFALAGISETSPRRVLRRLELGRPKLTLSFCETTELPVLSPSWNGTELRNYHLEDMENWARREVEDEGYYPDEGEGLRKMEELIQQHCMTTMLKHWGDLKWREYCTKDFNPFRRRVASISEERWAQFRRLWVAARREQLRRGRGLV